MFTVLCLNPSIDRTVTVPRLSPGGTNRIGSVRLDASGKGVNVALLTHAAGVPTLLLGLWGTENRALFTACFAQAGLVFRPIDQPGAVRMNIKVVDEEAQTTTELNEPGLTATEAQLQNLAAEVIEAAQASDYLVLTGSLPPGCPATYYADMIRIVKRHAPRCRCVLDASGAALHLASYAPPFLVKPNRDELRDASGLPADTIADVWRGAQALLARGSSAVLASLGAEGAMLCTRKGSWYAPALPVPVHSTVGAGDSLLAGVLCALAEGESLSSAFRRGIAMAAASVMRAGTEPVTESDWFPLLEKVAVNPFHPPQFG